MITKLSQCKPGPERGPEVDLLQQMTSVIVTILFILSLGALPFDPGAAGETCACGFVLAGWGSAIIVHRRPLDRATFVLYSLGLSFVTLILAGFLIVECRTGGLLVFYYVLSSLSVLSHLTYLGAINVPRFPAVFGDDSRGWSVYPKAFITPVQRLSQRIHLQQWWVESRSSPMTSGAISYLLSLASGLTALVSALLAQNSDPGLWGYASVARPGWYFAVLLAIGAFATAQPQSSGNHFMAFLAFVIAFLLAPAITYPVARYPYAAKHVGVVQYILKHEAVKPSIDIYQSWPGFFAGVALLCKGARILEPLDFARWWLSIIGLSAACGMKVMATRFGLNRKAAYLSCVLLLLANAIGQDYFSPQSVSFFLALLVFAIALRPTCHVLSRDEIGCICLVSVALAVTHQITPYLVGLALIVLVLTRLIKPWWVPATVIAPAVIWAAINLTQVRKYFSVGSIGDVSKNISTPGARVVGAHKDGAQILSQYSLVLGLLIVGLIALIALYQHRSRAHVGIMLCGASAAVLVVATIYGNEGIFRVALFALPWLCIAASSVKLSSIILRRLAWPVAVGALCLTYIFGDLGLDAIMVDRPSMVAAELRFEHTSPAGSVLITMGGFEVPKDLTSAYPSYHFKTFGELGSVDLSTFDDLVVPSFSIPKGGHLYIEYTEAAMYYGELEGTLSSSGYQSYERATRNSPSWRLVYNGKAAELFIFVG